MLPSCLLSERRGEARSGKVERGTVHPSRIAKIAQGISSGLMSATIFCLIDGTGQLHQYLDLAEWDGVASKWITRAAHFAGVLYSPLILDENPNSVLIFPHL